MSETGPQDFKYEEQKIMERRYVLPYNWINHPDSRKQRQKMGLWYLAKKLAGDINGKRVLDAGCGDGWYAAKIKEGGADVVGVDYSERAIAFAKLIVSAQFIVASIDRMPLQDGHFDAIFAFQVLEHISPEQFSSVIKELGRVLRKDGILVVSVPSINRSKSTAHFSHFTIESLSSALEPYFVFGKAFGQERHTFVLYILERLFENRFWFMPKAARFFNQKLFFRFWNCAAPESGQNIVALYKKL